MCNLYSLTKGQAAIRDWFRTRHDRTGNLPLLPGIFPDQTAPIVRNDSDGERELVMARWGVPGPPHYGSAPVTNIRVRRHKAAQVTDLVRARRGSAAVRDSTSRGAADRKKPQRGYRVGETILALFLGVAGAQQLRRALPATWLSEEGRGGGRERREGTICRSVR
jgi:hypothetical protein